MDSVEKQSNKISKIKGGARTGAGRPKGQPNKKTAELQQAVAESGITPLEYMLSVMRNEGAEPRERMGAALGAAPYIHPKLASIEHSGPDGQPIPIATRITLEALRLSTQ